MTVDCNFFIFTHKIPKCFGIRTKSHFSTFNILSFITFFRQELVSQQRKEGFVRCTLCIPIDAWTFLFCMVKLLSSLENQKRNLEIRCSTGAQSY